MSRAGQPTGLSRVTSALQLAISVITKPLIFALSFLAPRDDSLWVFMAGNDGRRFADNAKYLFLHCASKDVECVWITSSPETRDELVAEGYVAHLASSRAGRRAMLRAGVLFETHGPVWPEYTGGAKIVHLTHGNYFKTMLADHARNWPKPVEIAVELLFSRRRRYVVTGSGTPAAITRSMHQVPAERLLVTGFPRNDVLFDRIEGERIGLDESALEAVRTRSEAGPVLLYAPTWREAYDERNGIPLSDVDMSLAELDQVLEEHGAHFYLSPHPASSLSVPDDLEHVSVLDTGGDLYPFMRYCDALVTDYSGIFYDYLLLDRPIVFFAPDLDAYREDRDLYFEYETHVPGQIATDGKTFVDAVEDVLRGVDEAAAKRQERREQYYEKTDRGAAERVYRAVRDWIES